MSGNGETADTIHNIGKAQLADHLRLMADNQKDLDMVNASDRRGRDLSARVEEAQARKQFPDLAAPAPPLEADEVKINVDSPTTVNHNYPAPAEPVVPPSVAKPASMLAKAALTAALLGSGGGIGMIAAGLLLDKPDPPPAVDTTDKDTQFELRLVPPPENE